MHRNLKSAERLGRIVVMRKCAYCAKGTYQWHWKHEHWEDETATVNNWECRVCGSHDFRILTPQNENWCLIQAAKIVAEQKEAQA